MTVAVMFWVVALVAATTLYPNLASWLVSFPAAPVTSVPLNTRTVTDEGAEDDPLFAEAATDELEEVVDFEFPDDLEPDVTGVICGRTT